MTDYALFLESGPKMKTTMVHVLELLGCLANGPTTDDALNATPGEIREYLAFLQRHGEDADPDREFETHVEAHVTEGSWIGYGDPAPGFAPDFEPLTREELTIHLQRMRWMGEEIADLARKQTARTLGAAPEKGRPLGEIFRHIGAAHPEYVRTAGLGKLDEMKRVSKEIEGHTTDPEWLADNLTILFNVSADRFEQATDEELAAQVQRGEKLSTARRGLRRGLEHAWEHLREIERRLGDAKP